MNDLVFVMYNLKLSNKQVRKQLSVDDLSSDDEWIVEEGEAREGMENDVLDVLDGEATREKEDIQGEDSNPIHEEINEEPLDTSKDLEVVDDIGGLRFEESNLDDIF